MAQKVLVAMSGGVDSSVAAALLVKQGYFVVGGYMKNFSPESWQGVMGDDCPWKDDVEYVEKTCNILDIPFRSFNFEKEYEEKVINYFFSEYASGRTPNPDIMCNNQIKFGIFLDKAKELGFDFVATGHYARINNNGTDYKLLKGLDENKDQSYFLYRLNQAQLSQSLFPIGQYKKNYVRKIAKQFDLPSAERKDSQGVCFLGHINLFEFLKQRIPEKKGEIVTTDGEVIGVHNGAAYFTIGQRHGLGIGGGVPYFVADKDMANNRIVVSKGKQDKILYKKRIVIDDIHWISKSEPALPLECNAKIRYRQDDQECVLSYINNDFVVDFKNEQFAPASGQSIVFYKGEQVLGGGIIL